MVVFLPQVQQVMEVVYLVLVTQATQAHLVLLVLAVVLDQFLEVVSANVLFITACLRVNQPLAQVIVRSLMEQLRKIRFTGKRGHSWDQVQ